MERKNFKIGKVFKSFIAACLVLTLAFSIFTIRTEYTADAASSIISLDLYGKVTASKLNVRQNTSTSAKIIATVAKNNYLHVKGVNEKGSWYKVTVNNKTGYVSANYVTVTVKTSAALNLRKSATTNSKSYGCIKKGTAIKVLGYKNNSGTVWYKVTYNSHTGYICGKYTVPVKKRTNSNVSNKKSQTTSNTASKSIKTYSKTTKTVTVSGDNVRLRSKASKNSKVITTLSKGTVLTIKNKAGEASLWWYVSCTKNGKTYNGYVYKGNTKETWHLTASDLNKLCKIVMAEAGGESAKGQKILAQAMLDRASYYNSFSKACNQVSQNPKSAVTSKVKKSVASVLSGERITSTKVLWWYNPKVTKSSWHESKKYVTTVGCHRFFTAF